MGMIVSRVLFQPPDPPSYRDNGEIIWLDTKNGVSIPSVFLPSEGSDLVVIYSHGNATDLGQMMPYLELLRSRLRVNVFSYEYEGYGISHPKVRCSEARCYSSIEAAIDYLRTKRGIPTENMIVFGCSLGTGPTLWLTSKADAKFRGVILQSPFTSVIRIKLNAKKTYFDLFQNVERIGAVRCPIFFIHGKVDEVVPFSHGQKLHNMCTHKVDPLWIDYAGHNNIMEVLGVDMYIKRLKKFITQLKETSSSISPNSTPSPIPAPNSSDSLSSQQQQQPQDTNHVSNSTMSSSGSDLTISVV